MTIVEARPCPVPSRLAGTCDSHVPVLPDPLDQWKSIVNGIARSFGPTLDQRSNDERVYSPAPTLVAEWDGVVEESSVDAFWARLQDPTGEQPELRVEIALERIPADQRSIVAPGAHFYWTIEVLDRAESRSTINTITFRPPLKWSKTRRREIDAQADDLHRAIFG